MEENTPSKVGAVTKKIFNIMVLLVCLFVIIPILITLAVYFWHQNELLEQENKTLQEQNDNFTEMNNQAKVRDVVIKEEIEEKVAKDVVNTTMENSEVISDKNNIVENKVITNEKVYFEVEELGIKFLVDKDLSNELTYVVINKDLVNISSKKLNSINGNNCDSQFLRISRQEGKYSQGLGGVGYGNTVKQFDNFYIISGGSQTLCTNGQFSNLEYDVLDKLNEAINNSLIEI